MPVCQYFLQGKCNFGTRCRNEHPQTRSSAFGQSTSQAILKGGSGATEGAMPTSAFGFGTNRFGTLPASGASAFGQNSQSAFGQNSKSAFGQNSQSAFGQNSQSVFGQNSQSAFSQQPQTSFSGFNSNSSSNALRPFDGGGQKLADKPLDANQLRKLVTAPLIWKLSTFAPVGEKPSMIVGTDVSPEESRLEFVMAQRQAGGNTGACQQMFDRLVSDMDRKLEDIAANAQTYAAQWQQLHGDSGGPPFGQQQPMQSAFAQQNNTSSSAFGQPAFAQNQQQPSSAFGISNTSASSAFGISKQATASSAFGGASSAFGQNTSLALTKPMSFGNTAQDVMQATGPQRDLTTEEIEYFRAPAFVFGKIPDVPPIPELCS